MVNLRLVDVKIKGVVFVKRFFLGMLLFVIVYVINGVGLRICLVFEYCKVIFIVFKVVEVIDIFILNMSNFFDIDWKFMVESFLFRWEMIGRYVKDIFCLCI